MASQAEPLQTPRWKRARAESRSGWRCARRFGARAGKVGVTPEHDAAGTGTARTSAEDGERRVARILESITDAYLALDLDGRFTYLNRAARNVLSELVPNPDDLIGQEFNAGLGRFVEQYADQ